MSYNPVALKQVSTIMVALILVLLAAPGVTQSSSAELSSAQVPAPTLAAEGSRADADTLVRHGDKLHSDQEFRNALEHYHRALSIYKRLGDREGIINTVIRIGDVHHAIGEYSKALEYYQESWPQGEARTLGPVGAIYMQLGDYQRAFQFSRQALTLEQTAGDRAGEATYLINIGVIHVKLGQYEEAIGQFKKALLISQEADEPVLEATALNNLGESYYYQSEYQRALEHLFQALSMRQELGDPIKIASSLHSIGLVYESLAMYDRAIKSYSDAVATSEKAGYTLGEAQGYNDIGRFLSLVGQHQRAIEVFQAALAKIREIGVSEGEGAVLANIGFNYHELGEYSSALDSYKQALTIYRASGQRVGEAAILSSLARIYSVLGNDPKALEYLKQALLINRMVGYTAGEVGVLANIGLIYEDEGDYYSSFEYYSQSISILEKVRDSLTIEELRTFPASGVSGVYEHAVAVLLHLDRPRDAFDYSERARARSFLDLLGNHQVNPKRSENPELIKKEHELATELTVLEQRLRTERRGSVLESTAQEIGALTSTLEAKRSEYRDLLVQLQLSNPDYAALIGRNPLGLDEVQEMLRAQASDTTLVSYFVGAEETVIFVISSATFSAKVIAVGRDELRKHVVNLREQMKLDPILSDAWRTSAGTLNDWLIAPISAQLPGSEPETPALLGIVPHDLLHYLPFGLLNDGENALLDDFVIYYAPSASSLRLIIEERNPQGNRLLAFANPSVAQAPNLHHAVGEAQTVAALHDARAFVGAEAGEARFKKALTGEFERIHIAAHSDYDSDNPLFSAILMAEGEGEDGRLETREILNLDLSMTDLVVLSACETHLAELSRGDELLGLERAFLRAGSASLLTTLWSVDDAATADLMKRFYTHLDHGSSKAEALRLAQIETKADYPEPYYWAGFVLIGEAGETRGDLQRVVVRSSWRPWLIAGVVTVILAGIIRASRQLRRTEPSGLA